MNRSAYRSGIGAPFSVESEEEAPFDWHAGIGETSLMLYLKPELVRMERSEKELLRGWPRGRYGSLKLGSRHNNRHKNGLK